MFSLRCKKGLILKCHWIVTKILKATSMLVNTPSNDFILKLLQESLDLNWDQFISAKPSQSHKVKLNY